MKITVVGGTGLIGSKVVANLAAQGHEAVAAGRETGLDMLTGAGLAEALAGAEVVVDLSNSPDFSDDAVLRFFTVAGANLRDAARAAGVRHHVMLGIVGTDELPESGYLRAKLAQEEIVRGGVTPYTIIRSTQFFEFLRGIADSATEGDTVRVTTGALQPIAATDVAAFVTETATGAPVNGAVPIAGPQRRSMAEFVDAVLTADGDRRKVVADPHAPYFGTEVTEELVPSEGTGARLGATTFDEWLPANPPRH